MRKITWALTLLVALSLPTPSSAQHHPAAQSQAGESRQHAMGVPYDDLKWQPIVPELGADSPQVSILRVDPKTLGLGHQLGQWPSDEEQSLATPAQSLSPGSRHGHERHTDTNDLTSMGTAVSVALMHWSADAGPLTASDGEFARAIASASLGEAQTEESELYRRFASRV